MAVIGDIEDEQVRLFAGLEGAYGVRAVDGCSSVEGGSDNRLGGGQAHIAAGQGDGKLHITAPSGARIEVGCKCQQAACRKDCLSGGVFALRQTKGSAGQSHSNRFRTRQSGNVGRGGLHQVVGRDCT